MPQSINMVPEFTQDSETQSPRQAVDQSSTQSADSQPETAAQETETPSEPPAEEKPVDPTVVSEDTGVEQLQNAVQSLQEERVKILRELADLRGQRREIKQEQLTAVEQKLEDLKDVNPEDVAIIEKVIRSKGYVPKGEIDKMFYESVQKEELSRFLEKYPEYKPENDTKDLNWSSLQKELAFYRMPENPHLVAELLERAHKIVSGSRITSDRNITIQKRQVDLASKGGGGVQRSSSGGKTLTPDQRRAYEDGGWSEVEINKIEANLR